jgi:hypothetical protein
VAFIPAQLSAVSAAQLRTPADLRTRVA